LLILVLSGFDTPTEGFLNHVEVIAGGTYGLPPTRSEQKVPHGGSGMAR